MVYVNNALLDTSYATNENEWGGYMVERNEELRMPKHAGLTRANTVNSAGASAIARVSLSLSLSLSTGTYIRQEKPITYVTMVS